MTMRDQIADILAELHDYHGMDVVEAADAIIAALPAMIEAGILMELESACDAVAGTRSTETYLRMIDVDGALTALETLDAARSKARAALAGIGMGVE